MLQRKRGKIPRIKPEQGVRGGEQIIRKISARLFCRKQGKDVRAAGRRDEGML